VLVLYATGMVTAMAYKIRVRLGYVAVAYRIFCAPQNTIPPIAIFLVVSGSIKSEFTCCSNSFARALVIGPILILLDFFATTSSSSIGAGDNGGVIGMSSSRRHQHQHRGLCHLG
jgi:hypothetical protein